MKKIYLLTLSGMLLVGVSCQNEKKAEEQEQPTVVQNIDAQKYRTELSKKTADLQQKLRTANQNQANQLLTEYRKIFDNILDSLNLAEENTLTNRYLWDDFDARPDTIQQKIEQYDKLNLHFEPVDSTRLQLKLKPSFYYKTFQRKVSKDVRAYLLLESSIQFGNYDQLDLTDALGLIRKDLLNYEKFLTDYKNSDYYNDVQKKYMKLIKVYWYGTENRQHVSFSTKTMNPELEQDLISLVKKDPATITAQLTKKYADFFLDKGNAFPADAFEKEVKSYIQNALEKSFR